MWPSNKAAKLIPLRNYTKDDAIKALEVLNKEIGPELSKEFEKLTI